MTRPSRRGIRAVAALLWLPSLATLAAAKEPASYVKAVSLVRERKYHEAVVYLDLALSEKPDHVRAFDHLAKCHVRLGNFAAARDVLDRLASTSPSHRMTAGLEAKMVERYRQCARRLQRGDEAALEDVQAIAGARTARTDVRAHAALAIASFCYNGKQFARAAAAYDQVREQAEYLYDHDVPVRHLRSLLLSQQRIAAIDLYPKLTDQIREPYLDEAQKVLVNCVLQHARDVAHLDKPTRLTLRMAHDTFHRGLAALPDGSAAKATLDKELAQFEVEIGRLLKAQAARALRVKDTATASHCVADLLELAPRSESAVRGWAQFKKCEMEQAAHRMYVEGVRRLGQRPNKDYQGAIAKLEPIARLYPRANAAFEALYDIGLSYHEMGKPDVALRYYQRAMDLQPNSRGLCNVSIRLGGCYEKSGRVEDAIQTYTRAVQAAPKGMNADMCQFVLTVVYWEQKDWEKCCREAQKFLKLFPKSSLRRRVGLMMQSSQKHMRAERAKR